MSVISKFKVNGLHCVACQKVIQKKLAAITDAQVQKIDQDGELELAAQRAIDKAEVVKALEGTQYTIAA